MIKVCVNGYGTIGKRIAEAVEKHPKLKLLGVTKFTPDQDARLAIVSGKKLFVPAESMSIFESSGMEISGSVEELIDQADTVIDASSDGKGIRNKESIYVPKRKRSIFQGGEKADIGLSFNSRCNFDKAKGQDYVRVVSCNTTGYCRIIKPISENYKIKHIDAFLVRRGADPNDAKGSSLNAVEWKANSHHADDVRTIIDVPISSIAFKIPHTHCHVNSMKMTFDGEIPSKEDIFDLFKSERVLVLNNASTSSQIVEAARDIGMKRFDLFIPALLMNTFMANDNEIFISFAVPQESVTVPENLDALMAQSNLLSQEESTKLTDELLGLKKMKSEFERIFS